MFEISRRVQFVLGGIVGLNLMVGAAAATGVVPRPTETQAVAAVSDSVPEPTPQVVETPLPEETTTTTVAPATTVPPTTPTTAPRRTTTTPPATTPPTTAAPVATTTPTTAAPAPAPKPTVPARRNPSSAEITSAISSLRSFLPLTPSEAQARQLGTMVCDAFDAGQTYAQVKATALQQVSQIPFVTVTPAAADAILQTAVQLFCPGHASKLP